MRHTAFGTTGEISTPEKVGWTGKDKVIVVHKALSEDHEKSSEYCQGPYSDINLDVHLIIICCLFSVVSHYINKIINYCHLQ